jgi:glycosyltransferase involved in cell wall biosynthesis
MDRKADVIVPADRDAVVVERCLRSVLENSGPALGRLIVIDDRPLGTAAETSFDELVGLGRVVEVLRNPAHLGYVASCNRGIEESQSDVVLLACDNVVGPHWLRELGAHAHTGERVACVSPLSDTKGTCGAIDPQRLSDHEAIDPRAIRAACALLPRYTVVPTVWSGCVYLCRDMIDAIGILDSSFCTAPDALDDWVCRALAVGFTARRANHVYVAPPGPRRQHGPSTADCRFGNDHAIDGSRTLGRRITAFETTLDARIARHAVAVEASGKLRVALDLRDLPREQVGTRTYAVNLATALAGLRPIELTLLVRSAGQAKGLPGRVVVPEQWRDDVAVIHRPGQVLDPRDLDLLFRSSAHLVITYQDLIAYRMPLAAPSDLWFRRYRATSSLLLQASQRIVAISRNAAREIAEEFAIPSDEIAVVYHGVEGAEFEKQAEIERASERRLRLPAHFFFSLAADFPHKNLRNLLEAYAIFRRTWPDRHPPGLILAGHTSSSRTGVYPTLESSPRQQGVLFLGPVSSLRLRLLYQRAIALVFSSLYEGFGLAPLEAMAAGTPVIAMPISAVPEVVGDCACYPDGLSPAALARAMAKLASDAALRDGLRQRGLAHVEKFRWHNTATATHEVYRSAVLRPTERSLRARRGLRGAILTWAASDSFPGRTGVGAELGYAGPAPIGIRDSLRALDVAFHSRLRRNLGRLRPGARQTNSRKTSQHA